jgi:hypothetical protein
MIDVAIALLIVVSTLTVTLYLSAHLGSRQMRHAIASAFLPDPAPPDSDGELAEMILVSALLAGELSTAEYQSDMAVLAAGDAVQHPLFVPPG